MGVALAEQVRRPPAALCHAAAAISWASLLTRLLGLGGPTAAAPALQVLAEFMDALRQLIAAVRGDRNTPPSMLRLTDRVLESQQVGGVLKCRPGSRGRGAGELLLCGRGPQRALRLTPSLHSSLTSPRLTLLALPVQHVEAVMERREPSVRELFRTASRLAKTFVVRPPSGGGHHQGHHQHPEAGLTRMGSGGSGGGGEGVRRRSMDAPRAAIAGQLSRRQGTSHSDVAASGSVWPDGSRPTTPDDPGV